MKRRKNTPKKLADIKKLHLSIKQEKAVEQGADYPDDVLIAEKYQRDKPLLSIEEITFEIKLNIMNLWQGADAEMLAEEYHTSAKVIDLIRKTMTKYMVKNKNNDALDDSLNEFVKEIF